MSDLHAIGLAVLSDATDCSDHKSDFDRDSIETVLHARQWCYCETKGEKACGSYCDTNGAAVFALKGGGFAVATEASDTSGHG